jgi:hypothetical protein
MRSESDSESGPDNWWLQRRTDDDHFVFAYEFSKSVLCHVQQSSDWLVWVDRTLKASATLDGRVRLRKFP